ncbi:hypothetical protein ACJX0J_030798, partial [Zea mays]
SLPKVFISLRFACYKKYLYPTSLSVIILFPFDNNVCDNIKIIKIKINEFCFIRLIYYNLYRHTLQFSTRNEIACIFIVFFYFLITILFVTFLRHILRVTLFVKRNERDIQGLHAKKRVPLQPILQDNC